MWKDKDGKKLENEDIVIVEGKISGRHSSDRISVTMAPGQVVLIDASICRKGRAKPEPEAETESPEPEATVTAPHSLEEVEVAPKEGGDVVEG